MTDNERFSEIISQNLPELHKREGIGTYGEKSVHFALKLFFSEDEECREVPVGKYIADIKIGSEIYEIQSSGFGALRQKLEEYLLCEEISRVRVVYPVIENKRVIKISPETGEITKEYASPRHVRTAEIFKELLFAGDGIYSEKVSFVLVSLAVDEISYDIGDRRKRRGESLKIDKIPRELISISEYRSVYDMGELLCFSDGEIITASQIHKYLRAPGRKGWAAVRVLEQIGYITRCGKEGNKILYRFRKRPAEE